MAPEVPPAILELRTPADQRPLNLVRPEIGRMCARAEEHDLLCGTAAVQAKVGPYELPVESGCSLAVYVHSAYTGLMVRFEWDPKNAAANLRKHGVSFEDAQTVFADENAKAD